MATANKHSILLVDDEPEILFSLRGLLRREFDLHTANSGAEALEVLKKNPIHVIMTDQRMPEMTGVELLRRARGEHPEAIRIVFTGYADIKAVIDAINQGNVYRYINKPWEPQELQAVLRQAVEHYDLLAERKRLLAELQAKNRQLETANAELRQANELKKAFIKVASHELRTPLTIVLGLADLALRQPDLAPQLRHWLERIYAGSVRLNERVDQMIKLLLANHFERSLDRKEVDVADLLRKAAADISVFIDQRHQRLELDLPANLGTIAVEPDKVRDSVFQLLGNAVKFTPDGGTVRLAARRLPDGGTWIQVQDTGVGIEAACLPRVFEPFFTRFDVSRHSSGVYEFERRGLGLGLSVAKAFIEMHGGQVSVASELGKGSTFIIALPPQPPSTG
jgi:signal transduction histidine kinase